MKKYERILIFELNWLGDILFSFPFIRAVRKTFPDAYITCAVVPRYAELLAYNPWINFTHALSDDRRLLSFGEKIAFVSMIKKEKYDACFFLKPSRTKAIMAAMAGIPERIGLGGKDSFLTKTVDMPEGPVHRADQILALAGAIGVTHADGTYEYFFGQEDAERAEEIIKMCGGAGGRLVAVNPGGNWIPKRWPQLNYKELIKKLLARFNDIEIVITGAAKDEGLAGEIAGAVADHRCYAAAGKTSINELAAIFAKSELVISADSGPLHLASASGATTISIFGPTSPAITGPRGRGKNVVMRKDTGCAVPCYVEECGMSYACMKDITADEVFAEAEGMLS